MATFEQDLFTLTKTTSMKKRTRLLAALAALAGTLSVQAQNSDQYGSGLKLGLNQQGDKYVRFIIWNQIWARWTENNGATSVNGVPSNTTMDIGARRLRMLAYAQISPRYLVLAHFGINNQTFTSGGGSGTSGTGGYGQGKKPQIFFHDAYNEYAIIPSVDPETKKVNKFTMSLGAGLHYWNGVSRMGSASTLNFLMVDAPVFNWPLIENADQFARQYGIYIKGIADKFHYQFSYDKPFATNTAPRDSAGIAVDNSGDAAGALSGYVDYQFLDQESNLLPYRVGTYIGSKRVFNIGAGFYHQARGTRSSDAVGLAQNHDINLFAGDVFVDMPLGNREKNMAITAYGVYYNFDFGPNYLRTTGIMNTGTLNTAAPVSDRVLEGPGNARVLLGTGSISYLQAGLLLPKFKSTKIRLQPIAAIAYKQFDALKDAGAYWDAGCNIYIDAHNAKITGQYSSRPLYDATTKELKDRKGEFILQFQVAL
jgi:hypothetical protein